jgi:hypothetical protein
MNTGLESMEVGVGDKTSVSLEICSATSFHSIISKLRRLTLGDIHPSGLAVIKIGEKAPQAVECNVEQE